MDFNKTIYVHGWKHNQVKHFLVIITHILQGFISYNWCDKYIKLISSWGTTNFIFFKWYNTEKFEVGSKHSQRIHKGHWMWDSIIKKLFIYLLFETIVIMAHYSFSTHMNVTKLKLNIDLTQF
jgi:hypothetical protein